MRENNDVRKEGEDVLGVGNGGTWFSWAVSSLLFEWADQRLVSGIGKHPGREEEEEERGGGKRRSREGGRKGITSVEVEKRERVGYCYSVRY